MSRRRRKRSSEVEQHWSNVRALGCLITATPRPTLHHCHGGSMPPTRGVSQKPSDWLVVPLSEWLHTGWAGIDSGIGVETWEDRHVPQVVLLDWVAELTGVDVWERAGIERPAEPPLRPYRSGMSMLP